MKLCTSTEPVNVTLKVVGGKWKPLLLWLINDQPKRFGELKKLMPGVTQKMLTQQLRELEDDGLVVRTVYPVVPPKVDYRLSQYGSTLKPVLSSMAEWGEKHSELVKSKGQNNTDKSSALVHDKDAVKLQDKLEKQGLHEV